MCARLNREPELRTRTRQKKKRKKNVQSPGIHRRIRAYATRRVPLYRIEIAIEIANLHTRNEKERERGILRT